jgi:hypothetical protein
MINPKLRGYVDELLKDPNLLDLRMELATLRAKFREVAFETLAPSESDLGLAEGEEEIVHARMLQEKDDEARAQNLTNLIRLGETLTKMALRIREVEVGKQHYIHVSVAGQIVSAFSDIGRLYIQDPAQRVAFERSLKDVIRRSIRAGSARSLATSMLVPTAQQTIDSVIAPPGPEDEVASSEPAPEIKLSKSTFRFDDATALIDKTMDEDDDAPV